MDVLMPQLGETVAEGKITRWFKSVGDAVARGDNLLEIETDKVTVEVPSIIAGVLTAINADVGSVAPVGMVIAVVSDGASGQAAPPPVDRPIVTPPAAAPAATPRSEAPPLAGAGNGAAPSAAARKPLDPFREVDTPLGNFGPGRRADGILVTPLARRLAAGAAIDVGRLTGSGPRGRIVGRDVDAAIEARGTAARPSAAEQTIGAIHFGRPHRLVAVDAMRRTIAARLTLSKATIPHFYLTSHLQAGRLAALRNDVNSGAPRNAAGEPAYRLSLNDFLVKALALALKEVPAANAIWSADGILEFEHADVAVAVAVPGGLFTPVVQAAETKSVAAIAKEVKDLAGRARQRTLRPEEYQGGTTTISNLGMHGVAEFSAIINPPQATILAIGAVGRHAVENPDGGVAFVDRITATLACDHRVVDGVTGAELLESFKSLVENPLRMLV